MGPSGAAKIKAYEYIRANMLSLGVYSKTGESNAKLELDDFEEFEKEILDILMITRLLVGLYEKLNDQYKTSGAPMENEFYYTAYIYGLNNVHSTADVLEGFLKAFNSGNKIFATSYSYSNPSLPSKQQLLELYNSKRIAILEMNKKEYKKFLTMNYIMILM